MEIPQNPVPLSDRQAWVTEMHAKHVAAGAETGNGGTFLPAETIELPVPVSNPFLREDATQSDMPRVDPQYEQKVHQFKEYEKKYQKHIDTTSTTVIDAYPEISERFKIGVRLGVEKGYLPQQALGRLDNTVGQTAIRVVGHSIGNAAGQYDSDTAIIKIGAGFSEVDDKEIAETLVHELQHDLSGGTFRKTADGKVMRTRTGLSGQLKDGKQGWHMALTEAINTYHEQAIMTGDFEILDPGDDRHATSYYGIRKLLAVAIEKSGGVMDIKTLSRASFEDTSQNVNTSDRRAMVGQWRRSYGLGSLRKFDHLCQAAQHLDSSYFSGPTEPEYYSMLNDLADRIHPPILDTDGTVIKPGFIDIQNNL